MTVCTVNERSQQLLKALIECYISEGQPVASGKLAKQGIVSLSPASIRSVLADLEDKGYLHSPHTSAGRVPTAQGFRFFVDSLLTNQPIELAHIQQLSTKISSTDSQSIIQSASKLLSQLTQLTGIVTLPRKEKNILNHVEFLPLSQKRVLVILVTNETDVQNKILDTQTDYDETQLRMAGNYLTQEYKGKELSDIRVELFTVLHQEKSHLTQSLQDLLKSINTIFEPADGAEDFIMSGQENLLSLAEANGMDKLRALFNTFSEKRTILQLFDNCLAADGVQIFIGEESGHAELDHCSVVTAPYTHEDKVVGVLGVIGPTRMPYEQIISTVDITAKCISAALGEHHG